MTTDNFAAGWGCKPYPYQPQRNPEQLEEFFTDVWPKQEAADRLEWQENDRRLNAISNNVSTGSQYTLKKWGSLLQQSATLVQLVAQDGCEVSLDQIVVLEHNRQRNIALTFCNRRRVTDHVPYDPLNAGVQVGLGGMRTLNVDCWHVVTLEF
jgi:alkylhydroperoxidase/carboxymuconolactone decarboxylase family protein YurZ